MTPEKSNVEIAVARPGITLLMLMCGLVGAGSAGAVSAAGTDADVPRITVKYDARSLDTETGAQALYRRLVRAAEQVCPYANSGSLAVRQATQMCRAQALARAVQQINNPNLAALTKARVKTG